MTLWFLLLATAAALGLGSVFYLITRVRRFSCMRRLAERHKALSWLIAIGAVGLLFLFWFVNVYAVVIVVLHLALFWQLCDLVAWIVRRIRKVPPKRYVAGAATLVLSALYLTAGWIAAHHVWQTNYTVASEQIDRPLRIALIADSHLGITLDGAGFAAQMARIQAQEPDVVVLVGDFVDDDSDKVDMLAACDALGTLRTTFGVYFVYGNHDNGYYRYRNFDSQELRDALQRNGVTILEDETAYLTPSIALIGRRDRSDRTRADAKTLLDAVDPDCYTVVLNHQPNDYDAEAAAGADLVLSGHTHGGHIFPAGQIGLLMGANDAIYGRTQRDDTTFFVTSGLSGWAIPFKTGTFSEYVILDLVPAA